jgi:predicted DNA-binding transcriptional regulator YafY
MAFKDRPFFRRILDFDDLVRRGKPVTCASVAGRWETSTKTVQRFIDEMRDEFHAPLEFDRGRRSYVYTDPNWHLPWLPVEGKDLFAIGVAAKLMQIYEGTPAVADLKAVFDRLAQFMPPEIRVRPSSLLEKLYVHPQPFRVIKPAVWEAVANALREKAALEIAYRKLGEAARKRVVEPYALVLAAPGWLLAARVPGDDQVKTFYLSRIVEARGLDSHFVVPRTFNPEQFFGESIGIFRGDGAFRFRVRFSADVADWVQEVRWHPKQKITKLAGGELELELPTESLWEARRFVLSFGRSARALAPKELVEDLKREAAQIAKMYQ